MLPLTEPIEGSKTEMIVLRLTELLAKYPTVLAFHLVLLEIHRQREDRPHVSNPIV